MRNKKVILTVDLNCPYIQKKIKDKEFEEYVEYLSAYLNSPAQLSILKDNPQIIQAYEEVLDIMELKI
jgi:3-phosphoglycerate kinase